jgi:periplasmic protein TonB
MAHALYSTPWFNTAIFKRIRPGYVVSAIIHVIFFVVLAYVLAVHAVQPLPPDDASQAATLVEMPPTPKLVTLEPTFHPIPTPTIARVSVDVPPLPIPPFEDLKRAPNIMVSLEPPAPPVVANPSPISRGGLVYPRKALEADIHGFVDFDFTIGTDGSVQNPVVTAEVPQGYGFRDAASAAFPTWKFLPKIVDGKAIAAAARIRLTFKLKQNDSFSPRNK